VGAERDRGLDVVVHDERRRELAEAGAARDNLVRRRLDAELDDGRARLDRPPRRREVGHERVHPHVTFARPSRVSASSAASASYTATWNEPGPRAPVAASSPATPNATSASAAPSSGESATARKQPVSALDMQPVPVIDASIGSPFAIASVVVPSETW